MTTSIRSLRLIAFDATRLNTLSSERGEIFFDQTNGTLRFFDTRTSDGQLIATRAWVTSNPSGLPSQTGNSGKILTTNGSTLSWGTTTASNVGLGNVTNESKATMFASPTFTGTVSGVTATHVGLGSVTNESKATMFASPTFTGNSSVTGSLNVGQTILTSRFLSSPYQLVVPRGPVYQGTGVLSTLTTAIATNDYPEGIAVDPTGRFVYVANRSGGVGLFSINQTTGVLTGGSIQSAGTTPYAVTVDPTGRFLYVTNGGSASVSQFSINQTTGALTSITTAIASGAGPYGIAVDPTGRFVYVTNNSVNTVSQYSINQTTGALTSITTAIASGASPYGIAVDPTGRFVYVTNNGGTSVSQYSINQTTGALTSITTAIASGAGGFPLGVAVDPTGRFVYVANRNNSTVSQYLINQTTGALTTITTPIALPASAGPGGVTVDPTGRFVYVVNEYFDTVNQLLINQATGALTTITTAIASGDRPVTVIVDPTGRFVYVVNQHGFGGNQPGSISQYSINNFSAGQSIISSPVNSTNTQTGALQVVGGVGVGGSLYVGNTSTFNGALTLNQNVAGAVGGLLVTGSIPSNGTSIKVVNLDSDANSFSIIGVESGNFGAANVSLVANKNAGQTSIEVTNSDFYIRGSQTNKDIYIATNYNQNAVKVSGTDKSMTLYSTTSSNSTNSGALVVGGGVGVGGNLNVGGTLAVAGSSSGSVTLQAGATPAVQTYTLPAAYPSAGQLLTSTTNGVLSWVTPAVNYSLPTSSNTVLGGVKVDASSITINGSGVISVPAVATIGATNGIAQLGSDGKLVASQIPSSLSGAIVFKGTWNASTNTPTLADGVGTNGWEYAVAVGGTVNLGSGNITFLAGDYVIYNGTIWQRIPSNTVAEAGTLTGTTLNATVVTSSLTTVGTLTNLTVTNAITGSITGNAGTVTNGVVTTGTYADPSWITSLAASKVGLANVTNESKATMFASPTFTGTVSGVTKTHVGLSSVENTALSTWGGSTSITSLGTVTVGSAPASDVYAWAKAATKPSYTATEVGLGSVTNESKATMFASPTFTGTVSGVTATHVGLGNVTNESKATMFASPTFTGTVSGVTATHVGLGNVTNESKATMFASPTFTGTVSGVTATHVGLGNVTNESKATMFANPTFTGTVTGLSVTATDVGLGNVTNESKATMFSSPTFTGTVAGVTATHVGLGNVTNESKATMFASPTFTGSVAGISAFMISSLKYAKIEFAVTNVANAGYRLNYPDYSTSNNPIVYATAGETLAFNLNGISGNHPFLIQVNTAGTWGNYDLGLVHVGPAPTGTVSTGTNAQGKSVGMLYWTLPPDIAPGDYRYICSLHFNMTSTIRVKSADQAITSIRSTATANVDFGSSWANVNATYYKWDLPAAGTYLVWGTFRARVWGAAGYAKIRLYNQTAGTVVTDSDNMLLENQQVGNLNVMCTANWRYVATAATTLYLQGISTVGSGAGIQADANGWNECGFIRIT